MDDGNLSSRMQEYVSDSLADLFWRALCKHYSVDESERVDLLSVY